VPRKASRRGAGQLSRGRARATRAASTAEASTASGVPIAETERISAIDVLRGVAVLGILVMNIRYFAMPISAFDDPTFPFGFRFDNFIAWVVGNVICEDKMIAIFSMLFGAGIVIFTERAAARSGPVARLFYLRHFWLLVFGLLHAYGLWFGDILSLYAVCGMLLFPFRKLSPMVLIIAALVVYAVGIAFRQWPAFFSTVTQPVLGDLFRPTPAPMSAYAAYHGSWLDLFRWRAWLNHYWIFLGSLNLNLWRCSAFMLAGIALLKLGVLNASRSPRFYRNMMLWGYGIGIPLAAYGIHELMAGNRALAYQFGTTRWGGYRTAALLLASPAVALGHVGLVMQMCRAQFLPRIGNALAATGRMALTNYLGQTLVCVVVFDGWALGRFGRWGIARQLCVVLAICIAQMIVSSIWLRHFRFGPMEWLWRSLTYWKRQPLRVR
jgi:uncharacterized protein